jgi:hypothetical protein
LVRVAEVAAVAALLTTLWSCGHTADCRRRIDDCLRSCPPAEPRAVVPTIPGSREAQESPNECERRCSMICSPEPTAGRATPIEPASGPLEPPEEP